MFDPELHHSATSLEFAEEHIDKLGALYQHADVQLGGMREEEQFISVRPFKLALPDMPADAVEPLVQVAEVDVGSMSGLTFSITPDQAHALGTALIRAASQALCGEFVMPLQHVLDN